MGGLAAVGLIWVLYPSITTAQASRVLLPHQDARSTPAGPRADEKEGLPMSKNRPEVLFLCVHNAGRSQMAAALLMARAGGRIVVSLGRFGAR